MKLFGIVVFSAILLTILLINEVQSYSTGLLQFATCAIDSDCTRMCNRRCDPGATSGVCLSNVCYCALLSSA